MSANKIPVTVLTGRWFFFCVSASSIVLLIIDSMLSVLPSGFLGSGKTTLLNHILNDTSHGMKFAVIENEFGEIGVDEKILTEAVDEEVIEVMNGCICCTVRGDLVKVLKRLHKRVDKFGKLFCVGRLSLSRGGAVVGQGVQRRVLVVSLAPHERRRTNTHLSLLNHFASPNPNPRILLLILHCHTVLQTESSSKPPGWLILPLSCRHSLWTKTSARSTALIRSSPLSMPMSFSIGWPKRSRK